MFKKSPKTVRKKWFAIGTVIALTNFVCLYQTNWSTLLCSQKDGAILRKIINPPRLTETEEQILISYSSSKDKDFLADRLSNIVQNQIKTIQTPKNCDLQPNILCGHFQECGFGCQVHHRVACLMISYVLSLPLIHDEKEGWHFSKGWNDIFEPLGSKCPPGNNTFRWSWKDASALYRGKPCLFNSETSDQIAYPLSEGLSVTKELGNLVEKIHPNPFLWWVGQFMKFALKPRRDFADKIQSQKNNLGFSHPIVGFHVRRTDKITENSDSHHEINEYLRAAEDFLRNGSSSSDNYVQFINESHPKRVFIASDDAQVLPDAQTKYKDWNIIGFKADKTLKDTLARKDAFEEIVRDILILSECDYVVCGLTSNVCRLILEIMSSTHLDSQERLTSLDGKYEYILQHHTIYNPKIMKVEPSNILEDGPII